MVIIRTTFFFCFLLFRSRWGGKLWVCVRVWWGVAGLSVVFTKIINKKKHNMERSLKHNINPKNRDTRSHTPPPPPACSSFPLFITNFPCKGRAYEREGVGKHEQQSIDHIDRFDNCFFFGLKLCRVASMFFPKKNTKTLENCQLSHTHAASSICFCIFFCLFL